MKRAKGTTLMRFVSALIAIALLSVHTANADPADSGGFRLLAMDGHQVKWGEPAAGQGATLTYTVLTNRTEPGGINNCLEITGVDNLLARSHLTLDMFKASLTAALSMWEHAADVHFTHTDNPAKADVLIAAEAVPDGIAYTDVTPMSSETAGFERIRRGLVCLNPENRWADKGDAGDSAKGKVFNLTYVLAHEIGHVLGLDHPGPKGELMSFKYNKNITTLQPGDVAGIVALYGPPRGGAAPMVALNTAVK